MAHTVGVFEKITGTETPYTFYPRPDIRDFTTNELLEEIKRRIEK